MKIFLNAVGFLTVFRVSDKSYLDDNSFYKTLYYFPFVGFLIGLFGAAVYFISGFIFPGFLCLILTVLAEVFISGGMHLDGLSDTADGIFSGRKDKEKIIEIMKKSDIGAFGAISLVFLFILKITLLYSIFFIALKNIEGINILKNINHAAGSLSHIYNYFTVLPSFNIIKLINFVAVFSFMPALSRWTINFQLLRFNDFSSRGSLTEIFLNHKNKKSFMTASAYLFISYVLSNAFAGFFLKDKFLFNNFSWIINNFSIKNGNLMLIVIIPVFKSLIMISLIILIAETVGRFFIRKIGRLSGDAIGAVVEMTEIIYLFLVYIFIFIF